MSGRIVKAVWLPLVAASSLACAALAGAAPAGAVTQMVPHVKGCIPGPVNIVNSSKQHQTVIYETFFTGPATGTATEQNQATTSFSLSASVQAEEDFIFGSLQEQVSASIEHSVSAAYGSTYTVTVASGQVKYVAYVSRWYSISGTYETVSSTCTTENVHDYTATAPVGDGWTWSYSHIDSD